MIVLVLRHQNLRPPVVSFVHDVSRILCTDHGFQSRYLAVPRVVRCAITANPFVRPLARAAEASVDSDELVACIEKLGQFSREYLARSCLSAPFLNASSWSSLVSIVECDRTRCGLG